MHDIAIIGSGVAIGLVFGLFGAGGSAFATPVLNLLGVPGVMAVASPLPAMIPAAVAGARRHIRAGNLDRATARWSIAGGVPGAVLGSLLSVALDGRRLLILSGLILLAVGLRILLPDPAGTCARGVRRRHEPSLVVGAAFIVGLLTGVLANGGGFLLVPLYVLAFGLGTAEAAGTSMVAVAALAVPTLVTHIVLGHIDWPVAAAFAAGLVPGSSAGSALAARLPAVLARRAFGCLLVAFAVWFLMTKMWGA
ncbi:MAG: sulfite exporter TauE/SafE family protein [Actinomycetota bacterium]